MNAPKRPYEMVISIGADSLEALAHSLGNIHFDVLTIIEKGHSNPHISMSGSPDAGYEFSLVKTDTADHDEYFKKLDAYLEEIKAGKDSKED